MIYKIYFSLNADNDMVELEAYIRGELKSPITASKYMDDLDNAIDELSYYADSIGKNEYVQETFGMDARHITFKKMAIIYFIDGDYVYIQRIIPASLIY